MGDKRYEKGESEAKDGGNAVRSYLRYQTDNRRHGDSATESIVFDLAV